MSLVKQGKKLFMQLSESMKRQDLNKLLYLCDLGEREVEDITEGYQLFDKLLKKGEIEYTNLSYLVEQFESMKRKDLVKQIEKFQKETETEDNSRNILGTSDENGFDDYSASSNQSPERPSFKQDDFPTFREETSRINYDFNSTQPKMVDTSDSSTSRIPKENDAVNLHFYDDEETRVKGTETELKSIAENPIPDLSVFNQPASDFLSSPVTKLNLRPEQVSSNVSSDQYDGSLETDGPEESFQPEDIDIGTDSLKRNQPIREGSNWQEEKPLQLSQNPQESGTSGEGKEKDTELGTATAMRGKLRNMVERNQRTGEQSAIPELRDYQAELASPGLRGRNSIICAPTGSGKTLTAGFIARTRLIDARGRNERYKVFFIVPIRNLGQQQTDELRKIIPKKPTGQDNVRCIGETETLKDAIEATDVLVLTAQILVNGLKEKQVKITDFDLLIMDECHHTVLKHAYNNIMIHYLLEKKKHRSNNSLPQVLGLSASLGVGPDDEPLEHYITICANLDCDTITFVKDHKDELLKYNPKPNQDQILTVKPRDKNAPFLVKMIRFMGQIEGDTTFLTMRAFDYGSQKYESWVVDNRMKAEAAIHNGREMRATAAACRALQACNTTLMIYNEVQATSALHYLKQYFDPQKYKEITLPAERQFFDYFFAIKKLLEESAMDETVEDNQKLYTLKELLQKIFAEDSGSRVIVLTRTIEFTKALETFLQSQPELDNVVFPGRLVGQGRKEGTLNDKQQAKMLENFRKGPEKSPHGVNVLVATDVAQEGLDMPKCNSVIRYNFVSNEIGTVQSKGRARAKNSECYLIVDQGSQNASREIKNLSREHEMMETLKEIDQLDPREIRQAVEADQKDIIKRHEAEEEKKNRPGGLIEASRYTIVCKECKMSLCQGTDMLKKGSYYICTKEGFPNHVTFIPTSQQDMRYDIRIGVIKCKQCKTQLGPKIIFKASLARTEGYTLNIKAVLFKLDTAMEFTRHIQWSKVPFYIEVENLCDK